jgi:hypothetical protein
MFAWRSLFRLLAGWGLLLAGVLLMLDSNMPRSHALDRGRGLEAVVGFAMVAGGWWMRRRALRPPENPR